MAAKHALKNLIREHRLMPGIVWDYVQDLWQRALQKQHDLSFMSYYVVTRGKSKTRGSQEGYLAGTLRFHQQFILRGV